MTFTDEALRQLKEDLEIPERTMIVDEHEMRAILARLEAAEGLVCEPLGCDHVCNRDERYEAWRKAAGKSV